MSYRYGIQNVRNRLMTIVLTIAVITVPMVLAYLFWGVAGVLIASTMLVVGKCVEHRPPTDRMLQHLGASRLEYWQSPSLFDQVQWLSSKAGLDTPPTLHLLPDSRINAFTLGTGPDAGIVVSRALLKSLPPREVVAVIAHEMAHVANGDLSLLDLCERLRRVTVKLSFMGMILLVLLSWSGYGIGLAPWLLIAFAPLGANLLTLALSRTREFAADLTASTLMGEPDSLANALVHMETAGLSLIERVFNVRFNALVPESLSTHPPTAERVQRLRRTAGSSGKHARYARS